MKHILNLGFLLAALSLSAQTSPIQEKFQPLQFGSIKPTGWLKAQMQKDMDGFIGHLPHLVPDLMNDPIYGEERLHKKSKAKDLGNLKSGDAEGDDQYKWWNSETQSNWWDGYIRNAFLLDNSDAKKVAKSYIYRILSTQDKDGYLGIYDKELRYKFKSENGELWAKTTLLRSMLAYYEATNDAKVWKSIKMAVNEVMLSYPINQSQPFYAGKDFSGGVAHGLTFTDILDRLYLLTGDQTYAKYAAFLYSSFSTSYTSEKDVQLTNILDPSYKLQSHGVHTYEHFRPLIVAAYSIGTPEMLSAVKIYGERIKECTTPTGGAIGDEWIAGRIADAEHTGYEYCSLHELLDSYATLLQKSGEASAAEAMERIFYNAAQGSRNPDVSSIAYLKTDNSFEMQGLKNGEVENGRTQTRYKYSPVHKDVAVCCVPNAGRISPYFLQSCWLKEGENTLVAAILAPNKMETKLSDVTVKIEEATSYPFSNHFSFKIKASKNVHFRLKIRKPSWALAAITKEKYHIDGSFLVFERQFSKNDSIDLEFKSEVAVNKDYAQNRYFSYGPLIYAKPIAAKMQKGRAYAPGFEDYTYTPLDSSRYSFIPDNNAQFHEGIIRLTLRNSSTNQTEKVELVPVGKTILRQVTFKEHSN